MSIDNPIITTSPIHSVSWIQKSILSGSQWAVASVGVTALAYTQPLLFKNIVKGYLLGISANVLTNKFDDLPILWGSCFGWTISIVSSLFEKGFWNTPYFMTSFIVSSATSFLIQKKISAITDIKDSKIRLVSAIHALVLGGGLLAFGINGFMVGQWIIGRAILKDLAYSVVILTGLNQFLFAFIQTQKIAYNTFKEDLYSNFKKMCADLRKDSSLQDIAELFHLSETLEDSRYDECISNLINAFTINNLNITPKQFNQIATKINKDYLSKNQKLLGNFIKVGLNTIPSPSLTVKQLTQDSEELKQLIDRSAYEQRIKTIEQDKDEFCSTLKTIFKLLPSLSEKDHPRHSLLEKAPYIVPILMSKQDFISLLHHHGCTDDLVKNVLGNLFRDFIDENPDQDVIREMVKAEHLGQHLSLLFDLFAEENNYGKNAANVCTNLIRLIKTSDQITHNDCTKFFPIFIKKNFDDHLNNATIHIPMLSALMYPAGGMSSKSNINDTKKTITTSLRNAGVLLDLLKEEDLEDSMNAYNNALLKISSDERFNIPIKDFIYLHPKRAFKILYERYATFGWNIEKISITMDSINHLSTKLNKIKKSLPNSQLIEIKDDYNKIVDMIKNIVGEKNQWIQSYSDDWTLTNPWYVWFSQNKDSQDVLKHTFNGANTQSKALSDAFEQFTIDHNSQLTTLIEKLGYKNTDISCYKHMESLFGMELPLRLGKLFNLKKEEWDEDLFHHKMSELDLQTETDIEKLNEPTLSALELYIEGNRNKTVEAELFLNRWCGDKWQENEELLSVLEVDNSIQKALAKVGLETKQDLENAGLLPNDQELLILYDKSIGNDGKTFSKEYLELFINKLKTFSTKTTLDPTAIVEPFPSESPSYLESLVYRVWTCVFFLTKEGVLFMPLFFNPIGALVGIPAGFVYQAAAGYFNKYPLKSDFSLPSVALPIKYEQMKVEMSAFQQSTLSKKITTIRNYCFESLWKISLGNMILAPLQGFAIGSEFAWRFLGKAPAPQNEIDLKELPKKAIEKLVSLTDLEKNYQQIQKEYQGLSLRTQYLLTGIL